MKNLFLFISTMLLGTATLFANPTDPKTSLRAQIEKLLEDAPISVAVKDEVTAHIEFIVTKEGKIIVTNVISENSDIESFVKTRLNYQKIKHLKSSVTRFFRMPLKIIARY